MTAPLPSLATDHPTAMVFLDETGSIAQDRFFGVGVLKLTEPSHLLRAVQKIRDRWHWYDEFHWVEVTRGALPLYKELIDAVAATEGASFSCFVADRNHADPVHRFGSPWRAYEKLAEQLLVGTIKPNEIVTVLADNYSTPDEEIFEQRVKADVNRRLGRLAVTCVCRLDSKATDPLQVADLLTAAVAFEFRQSAGLAGTTSPKAELADYLRTKFSMPSALKGFRNGAINVALYIGDATAPAVVPDAPLHQVPAPHPAPLEE